MSSELSIADLASVWRGDKECPATRRLRRDVSPRAPRRNRSRSPNPRMRAPSSSRNSRANGRNPNRGRNQSRTPSSSNPHNGVRNGVRSPVRSSRRAVRASALAARSTHQEDQESSRSVSRSRPSPRQPSAAHDRLPMPRADLLMESKNLRRNLPAPFLPYGRVGWLEDPPPRRPPYM